MKRYLITVAVALCVMIPFVTDAQDKGAVTMKIKSLEIQKEQLKAELKELEKDWSRPRANLTEDELALMRERYDSLSLDKKSAILSIDKEIEELLETNSKE